MSAFQFNLDGIALTKSELKVIDYIYKHINQIPFLSINQLAEHINISVATLSRFVRHLGYTNYKDLKCAIVISENVSPADKLNNTLSNSYSITATQLLIKEIDYLLKTQENLSEESVKKAVEAILKAETIYLFGKGASAGLTKLLSFRLNRFHKKVVILPPSGSEIFEHITNISNNDLVIIFGFHKMPVEAKILLVHRKEIGYLTVLFTDSLYASEDKTGDINLFVYRGEPGEYHSMVAPTAIIDSLVIQVAKELKQVSICNLDKLYKLKEKYNKQLPR